MNITYRKMEMIEKKIAEREEQAAYDVYTSNPVNYYMKEQIKDLMKRARTL